MIDSFSGEYRWLSNFWLCPVEYKGVLYPSSEHAYVAAKLTDDVRAAMVDKIVECTSGQVKRLGRKLPLRPDWDNVRLHAMLVILTDKFTRNPDLAAKLLATGDDELVEGNHWGDTFWGVCDGVGTNWLGKTLMEIRTALRMPESPAGL